MTLKDLITLTEWLKDKPAGSMESLFNQIEEDSKEPGADVLAFHHISATELVPRLSERLVLVMR